MNFNYDIDSSRMCIFVAYLLHLHHESFELFVATD